MTAPTTPTAAARSTDLLASFQGDADEPRYTRKYYYTDVFVAYSNSETSAGVPIGALLDIEAEPENQYDPNAQAVLYQGSKVGYLSKGKLQQMVADYHGRSGCAVLAKAAAKENGNLLINLGFYIAEDPDDDE